MTIRTLQEGVINWFRLTPGELKSWAAVSSLCEKLFRQYRPDRPPTRGKYDLFIPLLRLGLVEFYGQGRYGLSPSCVVWSKDGLIGINLPAEALALSSSEFSPAPPFSITVMADSVDNVRWIRSHNVPVTRFNLISALRTIGSMQCWINGWIDEIVLDERKLQLFHPQQGWINPGVEVAPGLYRAGNEPYAPRFLKLTDTKWKRVPGLTHNPDAFNVAVTWSLIRQGLPIGMNYKTGEDKLEVSSLFFPILVERLLQLNSLSESADFGDSFQRKYRLYPDQYQALARIFYEKLSAV